jgi:hypothetical protein
MIARILAYRPGWLASPRAWSEKIADRMSLLGQLNPDARLRRERDHHLDRGGRQWQRAPVTADGQHPAHVPGGRPVGHPGKAEMIRRLADHG